MRNKFIAGNWKMNTTREETIELIRALLEKTAHIRKTTMMVAPPFPNLHVASELLENSSIHLGGQNLHWDDKGAFTGEVSALMLRDLNCRYVIVGHSERRQYFHETDETVNLRMHAALKQDLLPILCVGETVEERQEGKTLAVVERQVRNGLSGFSTGQSVKLTMAYEPRWAIGTGRAAAPLDAREVHGFIRTILSEIFGREGAQTIRIQYGGSVTPENIGEFMAESEIDGALVGGASLKADPFAKIIEAAEVASM